jgi:hypothetical protein
MTRTGIDSACRALPRDQAASLDSVAGIQRLRRFNALLQMLQIQIERLSAQAAS